VLRSGWWPGRRGEAGLGVQRRRDKGKRLAGLGSGDGQVGKVEQIQQRG
jgi:hypothetical protein